MPMKRLHCLAIKWGKFPVKWFDKCIHSLTRNAPETRWEVGINLRAVVTGKIHAIL